MPEAERLAGQDGVSLRDKTKLDAWYKDDHQPDRLNVWLDRDGRVERAEWG